MTIKSDIRIISCICRIGLIVWMRSSSSTKKTANKQNKSGNPTLPILLSEVWGFCIRFTDHIPIRAERFLPFYRLSLLHQYNVFPFLIVHHNNPLLHTPPYIDYGVMVKWTLPSFRKLNDFQSVNKMFFRFNRITTVRNSKNSEPAKKRKTSDLSLALIRFPFLFNFITSSFMSMKKAVNHMD